MIPADLAVSALARTRAALHAPPPPPFLVASGIEKRFGQNAPVLRGVSLSIGQGQATALIGSNGAGKSTLLRCLVRLIEPDRGSIRIDDTELTQLSSSRLRAFRAGIGFVFQRHNLVPRRSVLSNVLHGALARAGFRALDHSLAPAPLRAEAMAALERVGLAPLASRRADTLSGGQSQRVAIARALMQRPRLLLADEPVASLDPAAGEEVMQLFASLVERERLTLLFTTHHMAHAVRFSSRVVGLAQGAIALDAPATEPGLDSRLGGFFA